jgi:hypothetical protein
MKYDDLKRPANASQFDLTFGEDNECTRERMRELILYIADRSKGDDKFSATKLNKILYHSDSAAFRELGTPITGVQYMRLDYGPAPVHLVPVREQMLKDNEIEIKKTLYYTREQDRIIAKRKANQLLFSSDELAIVDAVIEEMKNFDASTASYMTHGRVWEIAKNGQRIPYEAAFVSDAGLTEDVLQWR